MTAETATLVAPREATRRMPLGWLWSAALLTLLTFLVIYPVSMLLLGALTNTNPVVDGFGVFRYFARRTSSPSSAIRTSTMRSRIR